MNNQSKKVQNTVNQQAADSLKSFILESVDFFADEHDIYDSIRNFQRLRFEMKPKTGTGQPGIDSEMPDMNALGSLLVDIAEARAKYNQLILDSYEQPQD